MLPLWPLLWLIVDGDDARALNLPRNEDCLSFDFRGGAASLSSLSVSHTADCCTGVGVESSSCSPRANCTLRRCVGVPVFDVLFLRRGVACGLDSLGMGKSAVVGAGPVAPGCASKGKLPLGAAGLRRTECGLLVPGVIIVAVYRTCCRR